MRKYATQEGLERVEGKVDSILTNHIPALTEKVGCLSGKVKTLFWIVPVAVALTTGLAALIIKLVD